jgi:alpha-L-fucosidase
MIERFNDARDWFFERRFGLFVHWGLYAIPGWHEQLQWRRGDSRQDMEALLPRFDPVRYNPDDWLDLAEAAGMRYLCFTTKHHDGFCLWDTQQTDFNVTRSAYGRDTLEMLAEACRRRDIVLCLYYSVIDWHHPNYPNQGRTHELAGPQAGDRPDLEAYLAFLNAQVDELCTQYGELGAFWWDMNVTDHVDPSINSRIRRMQPGALINGRGFDDGDFGTPEREYDAAADQLTVFERPTESCQSVGAESWGYKVDEDYYSDRYLIHSLDKYLARGANYLLNLGPMADGSIHPEHARILRRLGSWYAICRESLDGTTPAPGLVENRSVLLTRRENTLYVHLFQEPLKRAVLLRPLTTLPRRATLLNTGEPVAASVETVPSEFRCATPCLRLRELPVNAHSDTVMVIKLEFDEFPGD